MASICNDEGARFCGTSGHGGLFHTFLNLADQVQRRRQGLGAFLPLGGADLARVGGGELGSLELAQGFRHVAGDFVGVDFQGLDHAIGVDHERAAQCQAFFRDVHAESVGQLVRWVANQGEFGLAHGVRRFVPHLVREVGVGGHDVDLGAGLLELCVVVGSVFDFGGAVEGESCGHEDQHGPLALEGLLGHFDEFTLAVTVDESGGLEGLNLRIDQGHCCFLSGWLTEQDRSLGLSRPSIQLIDLIESIACDYTVTPCPQAGAGILPPFKPPKTATKPLHKPPGTCTCCCHCARAWAWQPCSRWCWAGCSRRWARCRPQPRVAWRWWLPPPWPGAWCTCAVRAKAWAKTLPSAWTAPVCWKARAPGRRCSCLPSSWWAAKAWKPPPCSPPWPGAPSWATWPGAAWRAWRWPLPSPGPGRATVAR